MFDKHLCKLHRFVEIYKKDNWIMNIVESDIQKSKKIEFKPVCVAPYSQDILFKNGEKILMMSATILDHEGFCETLGIPLEESAFISPELEQFVIVTSPETLPVVVIPEPAANSKLPPMGTPICVSPAPDLTPIPKALAKDIATSGVKFCPTIPRMSYSLSIVGSKSTTSTIPTNILQ